MADGAMLSVKLRQISWGVLAIEAFAIFLSVLLGFSVSAWREGRKNDDTRRQALASFHAELTDNQREIEARMPYHREALQGLQGLAADSRPRTFEDMTREAGFRGPQIVFLQETALRTADATGALALLDYPTAKAVTAVYELQRLLEATQDGLASAALNPAMFSDDNVQAVTISLMTYFDIVVEYEMALMAAYPEVLAHLDGQLGDSARALASPDSTAVPSTP